MLLVYGQFQKEGEGLHVTDGGRLYYKHTFHIDQLGHTTIVKIFD